MNSAIAWFDLASSQDWQAIGLNRKHAITLPDYLCT